MWIVALFLIIFTTAQIIFCHPIQLQGNINLLARRIQKINLEVQFGPETNEPNETDDEKIKKIETELNVLKKQQLNQSNELFHTRSILTALTKTMEHLTDKVDIIMNLTHEIQPKVVSSTNLDCTLSGPELAKIMTIGTRVVRGPDWKWGNQDGNPTGKGTIVKSLNLNNWVEVKWDNGDTSRYSYRMGGDNMYDLKLAEC